MSPAQSRSQIADIGLAPQGHRAIDWAQEHSPVLDGYVRQRLSDGALDGRKVAVVVHLEAKTAFLATVLADAGAQVVAAGSNPHSTRDDVAAALVERGIEVHSVRKSGYPAWEQHLMAVADTEPDFIIDDGAELTMRMARSRPESFARLSGVTEQTTTGVARLEQLHAASPFPFAAMAANSAACKHMFDNRYGTGQSTVQSILDITNLLMPGKKVAIIGYGWVGRGIATFVRALGGTAMIIEVDAVKALEAFMDGHQVGSAADVLPHADMVITASGGIRAIGERHFDLLKDRAILANAGHHDLEVDVEALRARADEVSDVRASVQRFHLSDGRKLDVLAEGALVNIAGGLGHPVEIMDLSFAVQGIGCHELARGGYENGIHVIGDELDQEIAAAKLAAHGVSLDALTTDQSDSIDTVMNDSTP